jgi:sugar lactone lactonase YvrE
MRPLCTLLFAFLLFAPKVASQTGFITTVAGNGSAFGSLGDGGPATSASLHNPSGLAFDSAGNLFISDTQHHRVRRVDAGADGEITGAMDEIITTVAGGGSDALGSDDGRPATQALFNRM